jgi:predicted metal-binding membrane protein
MAMLVVLGVMSVGWMAVIAVPVTAQKLLSLRAALDVPLALRTTWEMQRRQHDDRSQDRNA